MNRFFKPVTLWLLLALISLTFQQCRLMSPMLQAEKVGVKLSYSFTDAGSLNYRQEQKIDQEIQVGQQNIKVAIIQSTDFNVVELTEDHNLIRLACKLNSLSFDINAGGQPIKSDLKELQGKEFRFTLSDYGRESDMKEADALDFEIVPSEKGNLTSIFKGIFPDLSPGVLKAGSSWNSSDTVSYLDEQRSSELILENHHTLAGFVEIDGFNCAEIRNDFTGSIKAQTMTQGMEIVTDAVIKGTSTWYFVFDKGRFLKETSSGTADGIIKTPQGEMKLLRKFNNITTLVQ